LEQIERMISPVGLIREYGLKIRWQRRVFAAPVALLRSAWIPDRGTQAVFAKEEN
jgi:hypothetical protein